jgi:hypothetical protein
VAAVAMRARMFHLICIDKDGCPSIYDASVLLFLVVNCGVSKLNRQRLLKILKMFLLFPEIRVIGDLIKSWTKLNRQQLRLSLQSRRLRVCAKS